MIVYVLFTCICFFPAYPTTCTVDGVVYPEGKAELQQPSKTNAAATITTAINTTTTATNVINNNTTTITTTTITTTKQHRNH
ncbi:hypothetical protein DPMN_151056 [Dreissena polymorpha]|uniref:Uncharacterized protein n=1 Tax=Dreissena polymorpha TaxID=45954 RepID=A0A9D4FJ58_DREPO|nr:hypothetical protein DPMN_151056 [Dreissena polymorpha]